MKHLLTILILILMFATPQVKADTIVYGGFIPTISSSTNNGLICWSGTYGNTVKDCSGSPTFDASGNLVTVGVRITGATASRGVYFNSDKVLTSAAAQTAGYLSRWSTTGPVDSSFNQDASNNLVVPGLRDTGLTPSVPVETNADKVLISGTKTGSGSAYVMDSSPTIKAPTLLGKTSATTLDVSGNFTANDASPTTVWGLASTGTGGAVRATSPTITAPASNSGAERIVNGTFTSDISSWVDASSPGGSIAWDPSGAMDIISTGGAYARARQDNMPTLTAGRVYKVTVNIIASNRALNVQIPSGTTIITYASGNTGAHSFLYVAAGADGSIRLELDDTGEVTVDDVSVREVAALINGDVYLTGNVRVVIPTFANNAAAVAGGLVAGQFYRVNAATDPEPLYIVH